MNCLYCVHDALSSEKHQPPGERACEPVAVCTRTAISIRTASVVRSMMCGGWNRHDTLRQRLARRLQDVAAARRPCIQPAHAVMRKRHFPWHQHLAPTDQPGIGDGVMRGATRARRDDGGADTGEANDVMEAGLIDGCGEGHRRQDGG
jgi:hypothetical protein